MFEVQGYAEASFGSAERSAFSVAVASLLSVPLDSVSITGVHNLAADDTTGRRRSVLQAAPPGGGVTVSCAIAAAPTLAVALEEVEPGALLAAMRASGLAGALGVRVRLVVPDISLASPPPEAPTPAQHMQLQAPRSPVNVRGARDALLHSGAGTAAFVTVVPLSFLAGLAAGMRCGRRWHPHSRKVPPTPVPHSAAAGDVESPRRQRRPSATEQPLRTN